MGKRGRGCGGPGEPPCGPSPGGGPNGPGGGRGMGRRHGGWRANMEGHFRKHGFRFTVPRQIILEILEENEDFVSAEDLFMQVHERHPGIGLATVYRTLQLLVEIGVVSRIETGDGKGRFRIARQDERNRRAVLICSNCFKSIPLENLENEQEKLLEQLEDTIGAANEFSVRQSVLHFYGLCRECAQKQGAAAENNS